MKRTEVTIIIILALFFSLAAGLPVIREAKANPGGMALLSWKDIVEVYSPKGIYNTETVFLNFTVVTAWSSPPQTSYVLYNFDTGARIEVDVTNTVVNKTIDPTSDYEYLTVYIVQFNSNITDLADGTYSLTVQAYKAKDSVWLNIDTTSVDAAEIPEFPSWAPVLFMIVTATVLVVAYKQKLFSHTNRKI
ncbi:MAG: hypothetical protein JSW14_05645 [Candidatus Bathyarchaeum sp.]|nr:MAG: hypothetical protein JSW14_05645 [Candidatus Bathyarchaeum sp.]